MKKLLLLFLILLAPSAFADGGRLRFNQSAGPFIVTLFTTPDPLTAGQADFSVAVERQNTPGLVQDAAVTFILTPNGRPEERIVLHASHDAASSRFLQAANFTLPTAGNWHVDVVVQQGNDVGRCAGDMEVFPANPMTSRIGWNAGLIGVFVLLFLLHQGRKRVYVRQLRAALRPPAE